MSAFVKALATLHADPNFGISATFTQVSTGTTASLAIIWAAPNDIIPAPSGPAARATRRHADIQAADLLGLVPARGDRLRIGSVTYKIEDLEADDLGIVWRTTLAPLANPAAFTIGGSTVANTDTIA